MNMNKILDIAIEKDASDVHMIYGNKPMLRIARDLIEIEDMEVLKEEDMTEAYDYLVKGNVDKDEVYRLSKKLDIYSMLIRSILVVLPVFVSTDNNTPLIRQGPLSL